MKYRLLSEGERMKASDEEWVNWEDCWSAIPCESAGERYQERYWPPVRRAINQRKAGKQQAKN
jgi:hypothetical protein